MQVIWCKITAKKYKGFYVQNTIQTPGTRYQGVWHCIPQLIPTSLCTNPRVGHAEMWEGVTG